jgi:hypothetical protein
MRDGQIRRALRLNPDGTIGPPFYPGIGRYWFVCKKSAGLRLAIASEKEILREFTQVDDQTWESVQELWPETR